MNIIIAALGAEVFASYSPIDVLIDKEPGAIRLAGPCINALGCEGPQHIFGLDNNVRDVFARVLHGARLSLQVGFLTVGFAIGILFSIVSLAPGGLGIMEGSMTTIHANNPRDALGRMEQMVGMAGMPMSQSSIRSQISSAIHLIVQLSRMRDGTRRMTAISELTGMEGDVIQMQDIVRYNRLGVDDKGKIIGEFRPSGLRPYTLEKARQFGFDQAFLEACL